VLREFKLTSYFLLVNVSWKLTRLFDGLFHLLSLVDCFLFLFPS